MQLTGLELEPGGLPDQRSGPSTESRNEQIHQELVNAVHSQSKRLARLVHRELCPHARAHFAMQCILNDHGQGCNNCASMLVNKTHAA